MDHNSLTIILADGRFPKNELPLLVLKQAHFVVCCDGAAKKLIDWGREPDAIVGDMDSLSNEMKTRYADRIFYSSYQETNDLTKAIEWCVAHNITHVIILGATGLRDDHTLANVSLLAEYGAMLEVKMMTDTGYFTPIYTTTSFKCYRGQSVSIFSTTPSTEITTYGLKYPVNKRCFTNWWQGTLNETIDDSFTVEFDSGNLIVYQVYPFTL